MNMISGAFKKLSWSPNEKVDIGFVVWFLPPIKLTYRKKRAFNQLNVRIKLFDK